MIGQEIGSYRITEFIAKGEVSFVYKAYHPGKQDYFALKVFSFSRTRDRTMVRNFLHEAEVMAGLEHDFILPIYDLGRQEGIYYIVTRYVNADPLSQIMDEFRQPRHVITLVRPLANALEYLHSKNVIHGNVKPNNILVDSGTNPYLTSIGFAARLGGATTYGAYAAPEQALGVVNKSVDVYSLGILTYELLAGELPTSTNTRNIRTVRPDVPARLSEVLLKATDPESENRHGSTLEFSDDLISAVFPRDERFISGDSYPMTSEVDNSVEPSNRGYKRQRLRKVLIALIMAALLLLLLSITYLLNSIITGNGNKSQIDFTTVTFTDDANVRSGPGVQYPVVGVLRTGETTIASGTSPEGDWYRIYYRTEGSERAWVSSQMINREDSDKLLPVVAYTGGELSGGVEIASSDVGSRDSREEENSVATGSEDNGSLDNQSAEEPDNSLMPTSICGLPAGILLLLVIWPVYRSYQMPSPNKKKRIEARTTKLDPS